MPKATIWTEIRNDLETDIRLGRFAAGTKLPTEAELAARFGVNRHTVRRAIASLVEAGLALSRQGAGVSVASPLQRVPTPGPRGVGVEPEVAKEALRMAAYKLPVKARVIERKNVGGEKIK